MKDILELLCSCALPAFFVLIGLTVGRIVEQRHLAALDRREADLRDIGVSNLRGVPDPSAIRTACLVSGSVVIGSDYFKTFISGLKSLVGGELRAYEKMLERARREALCRLLEDAKRRGASMVINVRYETSNIAGTGQKAMPMAEVFAFGTAIFTDRSKSAGG